MTTLLPLLALALGAAGFFVFFARPKSEDNSSNTPFAPSLGASLGFVVLLAAVAFLKKGNDFWLGAFCPDGSDGAA